MKRVFAVILAAVVFLPLIAASLGCDSTLDKRTVLSAVVNPECLAKYGWAAGL